MIDQVAAYRSFAAEAQRFCRLVEELEPKSLAALVPVNRALASLHYQAVYLPPVTLSGKRLLKEYREDRQQQARALFLRLRAELPVDTFRWIFSPLKNDEKPVGGSVADSLADIWYDLIRGLDGLERLPEDQHVNIWWQWKFNFETHWGRHALEVLYVFYDALRDV